jgi:hypothetical protein
MSEPINWADEMEASDKYVSAKVEHTLDATPIETERSSKGIKLVSAFKDLPPDIEREMMKLIPTTLSDEDKARLDSLTEEQKDAILKARKEALAEAEKQLDAMTGKGRRKTKKRGGKKKKTSKRK